MSRGYDECSRLFRAEKLSVEKAEIRLVADGKHFVVLGMITEIEEQITEIKGLERLKWNIKCGLVILSLLFRNLISQNTISNWSQIVTS
jgi:hypothetical protein